MRISVHVYPGSRRNQVGGSYGPGKVLVVRVTARAVKGQANEAVVRAVAEAFGVRASAVSLQAGFTGRQKLIEVGGADPEVLEHLLSLS